MLFALSHLIIFMTFIKKFLLINIRLSHKILVIILYLSTLFVITVGKMVEKKFQNTVKYKRMTIKF